MSQLPHSALTRSKLEAYRKTIHQEWIKDTRILEIERILSEAGCTIGRTRISTWIENEVTVGRFPPRPEPLVGRPKKHRPLPELGPLPTFDVEEFKEMENFLKAVAQQIQPEKLAAQLVIPSKLGNPDYEGYARRLGGAVVSRLGKMDYILLGMYSTLLMFTGQKDNPNFVAAICKGAESIRTRMRNSVALDS